jgi:hypothetical protein
VAGLALVLAVGPGAPPRAAAAEIEVVAEVVADAEAPRIDGRVEPVWERAPAVRFALAEGSQGTVEVTLRALRTGTHLYLLLQWPDKTESLNRFREWTPGGWRAGRGREDRLNLAWPIGGSVPAFPATGCQGLCHKTEGVMKTGVPPEKVDLWYWMAQRTNPTGYGDNWTMGAEPALVEGQKTGRRPDVPAGGPFEPNWDDVARRPKFTFKPGVKPGPVLQKTDAVPLGPARPKAGDRLPREVLGAPSGPRAAIEARGAWERGQWTVELRRALETGSPDDVQLTGPGPFYFAVSIHDDAEKDEHAHMGRDVLRLRWK